MILLKCYIIYTGIPLLNFSIHYNLGNSYFYNTRFNFAQEQADWINYLYCLIMAICFVLLVLVVVVKISRYGKNSRFHDTISLMELGEMKFPTQDGLPHQKCKMGIQETKN